MAHDLKWTTIERPSMDRLQKAFIIGNWKVDWRVGQLVDVELYYDAHSVTHLKLEQVEDVETGKVTATWYTATVQVVRTVVYPD
jgi:hypothetical protein